MKFFDAILMLFYLGVKVFLLIIAYRAVKALEASARAHRGMADAFQQIAQQFRKPNEEN